MIKKSKSGPIRANAGLSKRESNRLQRRAAIIAVAREHFLAHGYSGTVMSEIAAKLGSKTTLWSYFPSKEALFGAMVEDTASVLRSQVDLSGSDKDPTERLMRLCRSIIDNAVSPLSLSMCRLMYAEVPRHPRLAEIFHERANSRFTDALAECLATHFEDFLKVGEDPREAARLLVALCTGGVYADMMWGAKKVATVADREADALKAAKVFLQTYAKDPRVLTRLSSVAASAPAAK